MNAYHSRPDSRPFYTHLSQSLQPFRQHRKHVKTTNTIQVKMFGGGGLPQTVARQATPNIHATLFKHLNQIVNCNSDMLTYQIACPLCHFFLSFFNLHRICMNFLLFQFVPVHWPTFIALPMLLGLHILTTHLHGLTNIAIASI